MVADDDALHLRIVLQGGQLLSVEFLLVGPLFPGELIEIGIEDDESQREDAKGIPGLGKFREPSPERGGPLGRREHVFVVAHGPVDGNFSGPQAGQKIVDRLPILLIGTPGDQVPEMNDRRRIGLAQDEL